MSFFIHCIDIHILKLAAVFDEEICTKLFTENQSLRTSASHLGKLSSSSKYRLINGNVWNLAPRSLRLKYIRYRLKGRYTEPNLFAYLFTPVYERRLAELGIADDDEKTRNKVFEEILDLVACSKLAGSTIAHKSSRTPIIVKKAFPISFVECTYDEKDAQAMAQKKQAKFDCLFLKFALAVLHDEPKALQAIENGIDLKRQSLCFGTSMFLFCLRRGSIGLVRRVIQHDPSLVPETKRPTVIFAAAAERSESARECVNLLLQHSNVLEDPVERKFLLEFLSKWAGEHGYLAVVQGISDWLEKNWRPNSYIFPLAPLRGSVKTEAAVLWFNDPECRLKLLQLVFSHVLSSRRTRKERRATKADIFFKKPEIALLHFLLKNGVDVNNMKHLSSVPFSPLLLAVQRGLADWADVLLQAGAGNRYNCDYLLCYADIANITKDVQPALLKMGHSMVYGRHIDGCPYYSGNYQYPIDKETNRPHTIEWKRINLRLDTRH